MNRSQVAGARVIRFVSRSGLVALLLAAAALLVPAAAMGAEGDPGAPSGNGIQPTVVPGNPTCADYGLYELKVDPPASGTYEDGVLTVKVTVKGSPNGQIFDWESNIGVDLVIAKGGKFGGNLYTYDPPEEATADTGLHTPINNEQGEYANLSHITFCYDIELEVTKNANTTFTRDYEWQIEKSNSTSEEPIKLAPGQSYEVGYEVTASILSFEDSEWAVSGEIEVHNPAPDAAEGVVVTDEISGFGAVTVDCGGETTIPAGGTLVCTYESGLPDGEPRSNEATATTTTPGIGEGSGTAAITFGEPTKLVDDCIAVSDDNVEPSELGEVCVGESPMTFKYKKTFGPFPNVCETYEYTNTASFVTNDTQEEGEDSSKVVIEVQCTQGGGCTLTQGYWKTHSHNGPAPYDDTWVLIPPEGEESPFFDSPWSWYEAFWEAPQKGNAYLILAHQYMAAVLNELNGASAPPEVIEAIEAAEEYLSDYGKYDGKKGPARKEMLALAQVLAEYNEGDIGPGHCDEDGSSSSSA
jgi:hypothetical protein